MLPEKAATDRPNRGTRSLDRKLFRSAELADADGTRKTFTTNSCSLCACRFGPIFLLPTQQQRRRRRLLVCDVVFEGSLPRDPDNIVVPRYGAYMTSLIIMGYAVKFAVADANADLEYHERNLADDVKAYGTTGKVRTRTPSRES